MSGEGEKIDRRRQCARGSSIESTSHKIKSSWNLLAIAFGMFCLTDSVVGGLNCDPMLEMKRLVLSRGVGEE